MADEPRCCYCNRATDKTLNERQKFTVELRPYGPGGAWLCFECMTASPDREAEAKSQFQLAIDANAAISESGAVLIGASNTGVVPLPETMREAIEDGTLESFVINEGEA